MRRFLPLANALLCKTLLLRRGRSGGAGACVLNLEPACATTGLLLYNQWISTPRRTLAVFPYLASPADGGHSAVWPCGVLAVLREICMRRCGRERVWALHYARGGALTALLNGRFAVPAPPPACSI